jgi:phage FluMu protein Com
MIVKCKKCGKFLFEAKEKPFGEYHCCGCWRLLEGNKKTASTKHAKENKEAKVKRKRLLRLKRILGSDY